MPPQRCARPQSPWAQSIFETVIRRPRESKGRLAGMRADSRAAHRQGGALLGRDTRQRSEGQATWRLAPPHERRDTPPAGVAAAWPPRRRRRAAGTGTERPRSVRPPSTRPFVHEPAVGRARPTGARSPIGLRCAPARRSALSAPGPGRRPSGHAQAKRLSSRRPPRGHPRRTGGTPPDGRRPGRPGSAR